MNTSSLYHYGKALNTHDAVKAVAILLMLIDHSGQFLLDNNVWCRLLGRGAAPLFFFLIGYTGKLHANFSLVLYGLILSFTGFIFYNHLWINILLYFIFIHCFLSLFPPESKGKLGQISFYVVAFLLHPFISRYVEYGSLGLLLAYSAHLIHEKDRWAKYWLAITLFSYYLWQGFAFQFYIKEIYLFILALICVSLYTVMCDYTLRPLSCPTWVRLPGLLLSRYSLAIYFYHLFILQIIFISSIFIAVQK